MTLPANPRRDRYVANAGQTVFPYTFRIFAASDLVVERLRGTTTTTLQLNVDYTVSGVGNNTGGNVTLTQGAEQDDIIAIVSNQPNQRSTDFTESGDFRAAALNAEFDRIWIAIQQVAQDVSRQITRPLSDPSASYVLPPASVRANKYLAFGPNGQLTFPVPQPAGPNAAEAYWWAGTAGGTANALTIFVSAPPTAYAEGQRFAFVVAANNTGAATLAVNGLGAKSIRRPDGSTLAAGDLVAGTLVAVTYDGTNFRLASAWVPLVTTFNADLTVSKPTPALILNKTASGQAAPVFGRTNGSNRWAIELGDPTAEGGGNAGSNLVVRRYNNAGAVLGAPVIINRASGAVTLEAPLTLPASNPTDANHATRKAYVDAGDRWVTLVDAAIANSAVIDVTGFSLADYYLVEVHLLNVLPTANSSSNVVAQLYRNQSLVSTGYNRLRLNAYPNAAAADTATNASSCDLTASGIRTERIVSNITMSQTESNQMAMLRTMTFFQENFANVMHCQYSYCRATGGSGWVDGLRITSPVDLTANVGRLVVMGLKKS
jgi:hypothetical protein